LGGDIPIDVPSNQNIGGDVSPGILGGVDASVDTLYSRLGSGEGRVTPVVHHPTEACMSLLSLIFIMYSMLYVHQLWVSLRVIIIASSEN